MSDLTQALSQIRNGTVARLLLDEVLELALHIFCFNPLFAATPVPFT